MDGHRPSEGAPRERASLTLAAALAAALAVAGVIAAAAFLAWRASRRYERYEVAGSSMAPTVEPGDWVLVDTEAYRRRMPRPGHVVLACDPREPAREVVKRVVQVDLHNDAWLEGDNPSGSTDSRTYGPVPKRLVVGRVRWRYWPRPARVR
jgi:nickel-type superoxide dismutase maturation protease